MMEYPATRVIEWVEDTTGEVTGSCRYVRLDAAKQVAATLEDLIERAEKRGLLVETHQERLRNFRALIGENTEE